MHKKSISYLFFIYIFTISIIIEANSIYSQLFPYHYYIRLLLTVFLLISTIYLLLKSIRKSNNIKVNKRVIFYIAYLFIASSFMIIKTNNKSGYAIIFLIFLIILPLLLILFMNIEYDDFRFIISKFVNIVVLICIISLLMWSMSSILHIIMPTSLIKVVWGKPYSLIKSYYYIHFDTQDVWWITGNQLIRNTGIYTEGPMYALVILVAIIFNNILLFGETKNHLLKSIVLYLAMFSTMSVTGIICSLLIFVFANFNDILNYIHKLAKYICLMLSVVLLLVSVPIGYKLLEAKNNTPSAQHRNMDISNGLKVFCENPLFGKGINHERDNESNFNVGYGYSNTIIPILTDGGILLFLIYYFPCLCTFIVGLKKMNKKYLCLVLIYLIITFTTLVQYRLITMLLLAIMMGISFNKHLYSKF